MKSYDDVREDLKTGDIVLFSGKGGISSIIKLFTSSKWSHMGMVLRLKFDWDVVFLWESTKCSSVPDKGVQLVPLSERLRAYDGEVSIRHLRNHEITQQNHEDLMKLRKDLRNRPYEEDRIELLKAAWDGPLGKNEEDISSLFCSELVAEAYQELGLLHRPPKGLPSNEFTPKDFSEKKRLKLQKGATLSKEILIK